MIEAVIFDMDGTIFDTERMLYRAWCELVRQGVLPENVLELVPKWRGMNRSEVRKKLSQLMGPDFDTDAFYEKRKRIIFDILDREGVPLKPGVPEIFIRLRAMGYPLALATATNRESVSDYMRRTGYGIYFQTIITGDRVERCKPAPDIFLLAARELGIAPENCLVIEDTPNGVRAGLAAGMQVIMVPDIEQPDDDLRRSLWRCFDTLSQIPQLIQSQENDKEKTL